MSQESASDRVIRSMTVSPTLLLRQTFMRVPPFLKMLLYLLLKRYVHKEFHMSRVLFLLEMQVLQSPGNSRFSTIGICRWQTIFLDCRTEKTRSVTLLQ